MSTADQLFNHAHQVVGAELLYRDGINLPGRNVVIAATTDGLGNVKIVHVPGITFGRGGTKDILLAAVRQIELLERQATRRT